VVLIAVMVFVSSFVLTYAFAVRPLRRWLSISSGVPLAEFAEKTFDRMEEHHHRMEQSLGRAEWSARLLSRELRKTDRPAGGSGPSGVAQWFQNVVLYLRL
jgi:hypothetical protein